MRTDRRHTTMHFANDRPIFVFGMPRSGSTLVQRVINSSGAALIVGEHRGILNGCALDYLRFFASGYDRFLGEWEPETFATGTEWVANAMSHSSKSFNHTYRTFVEGLCNPHRVRRWGFKEIRYGRTTFDFLKSIFPSAQFVFVVRNPADALASQSGVGWWNDESLSERIQIWRWQAGDFLSCRKKHPQSTFFVTYEHLCGHSDMPVTLLRFLGLEPTSNTTCALTTVARGAGESPSLPNGARKRIELETQELYQECVAESGNSLQAPASQRLQVDRTLTCARNPLS